MQLQTPLVSVVDDGTVLFDALITDVSPNMSYNAGTGEVTITASGIYYVHWWVATDGAEAQTFVSFAVNTSSGDSIIGSSPIVSGQLEGNALLEITATLITPVTLQLVNVTGATVGYGTAPVQADMTILEIS